MWLLKTTLLFILLMANAESREIEQTENLFLREDGPMRYLEETLTVEDAKTAMDEAKAKYDQSNAAAEAAK